jgi:hypothetical protein
VQYFGDYSRARVSPAALIPPSVALAQRLWLPPVLTACKGRGLARMVDVYLVGLREFITYCRVRWKRGLDAAGVQRVLKAEGGSVSRVTVPELHHPHRVLCRAVRPSTDW